MTFSGELFAVDTTARVPLNDPAAVGANVTVNVTLSFGEIAAGKIGALTENSVALMLACEIVSADRPVFVTVSERLELLPFCTLPKESVEEDMDRKEPPFEPEARVGATP